MIADIRKFIEDSIGKCDQNCRDKYQQIENPFFKDEDLVGTKVSKQFNILFGPAATIVGDKLGNVSAIPVTLKTYCQGEARSKKLAAFDTGYEEALIIKALILDNIENINNDYMKGVTSSEVTPIEVLNSQDIYSFETNFIFTISYGIGE